MDTKLFKNLANLFYAVAKADGKITIEEYHKLIALLDDFWSHMDSELIEALKHQFNQLYLNNADETKCFKDFIAFYNNQSNIFSKELKHLILSSANSIAYAYAKINKSELTLLAKLSIAFNKS